MLAGFFQFLKILHSLQWFVNTLTEEMQGKQRKTAVE